MENEKRKKHSDKYDEKTLKLATIIAAQVFKTLSNARISYDGAVEIVTASREIVDDYMQKAKAKFAELTSANKQQADDEKINEASEKADRIFRTLCKAELDMAKSEGREVSISRIKSLAKRVVFSQFRNVDGIDLKSIETGVKRSPSGEYKVRIIINRK